ncbi:probable trehalose-phosphate phosphatase F isoform X3 [Spinacia oleracea]|uniref:Probable trehalose-phosphate phosphatase F isoform X3 n=1 Tax=Spinacia oleracea TaxID=3562 RepID=A0A9R0I6B4_SPIOL|nr:probable trehalose-phosphate phosphatase F isoform X3 [Spinacia oleracea]
MDIMSPVHKVCNGHSNTNESTDKQDKEVSLFQPASEFLPMIDEVFRTLVDKTKGIKGVNVEIYKFFSYVHYRNVDEKNWPTIAQLVHQVLKSFPRLRLTHGCKIVCYHYQIGPVQEEFKIPVTPEEYTRNNLKFSLVDVVYEWEKRA